VTGPIIDFADDIECPYCGYIDPDSWEVYGDMDDGGTKIDECLSCGKKYEITMNISYNFDMEGKEETDDRTADSKSDSGSD